MRRIASLTFVILACALSVAAQAPEATTRTAAKPTQASAHRSVGSAAAPHTSEAYGNVPLAFEENRGQTDSQVKYLARGKGYTLFLMPTREVLALRRPIPSPENPKSIQEPKDPPKYSRTVVEFDLAGANQDAQISGTDLQPGISNYYIGNDPARWRTGILNYGRVLYRNAYPGIDIVYYGHQGQLESDFILAPGADPGTIRMRVQGAKDLEIAGTGDLVLSLEAGSVRLQQPVAYQIIGGERREIQSGYKLLAANEVGITLAPYDRARKLIIDPTLTYSTYLGGSGSGSTGDAANTVVVDAAGEAYVTGYTHSTDFPTQNAEQGTLGATGADVENAFVTKFAANGTSLVFSTYLGGSGVDGGNGIAIDSAGSAYVVGSTNSSNFPTKLPLPNQNAFIGGRCAFVSAFSSAGALTFSTFLCGGVNDYADGVAVDSSKDIYVTGITSSASFPTVNPVQASLAGTGNAFVSKLAAVGGTGSSLLFSSFFGGNGSDFAQAIALDGSNPPNVYICGSTTSSTFPTKNPIPATHGPAAGGATGFVAEMSVPAVGGPVGPSVVYATFLGGSTNDDANGIAADSPGNAYVTGLSESPDFPLKNSLQAFDAGGDTFIAKIAAGGGSLDFSTYFGGSAHSSATAIALDTLDNIYITGTTSASDFPTRIPLQATLNNQFGVATPFVTEFKADGSDYIFSTYLGGSHSASESTNFSNGIAVDSLGNIYVVGQSVDSDFPTVSPFQASLKTPNGNAFVAKIEPATPAGPQLFPSALNFGSVTTGTPSQTQVVTLANGTNALDITSIVVSGPNAADFSDFSTCGQTVPATVVCTFTVTFTPSSTGSESATVTVNESSGTQSFTVTGAGAAAPPPGTITVSPTTLTFGSQEVGTFSTTPQLFTVTVTSTNTVTLTGFTTTGADSGDFSIGAGTTCAFDTPLTSGTSCKIGLVFTPSAVGARSATIQISGTFTNTPATVNVSGTGTAQIAKLAPTFLQFPNTVVGTTSSAMTATLTNLSTTVTLTGISPTVTSFVTTASFSISANTCPGAGLGPGLSCTISITFSPTAAGFADGVLTVTDSDPASQSVPLFGTGLNASATLARVSPAFLTFGRQTAGTTSAAQAVSLQNIGNTSLAFTTPLSGTNSTAFQATNNCSGTIAPGASCEVGVTFSPTVTGPFFATLTISSSATGAPQTVGLSGTGIPATTVSLLPNPLVFPAISVGQTSATQYAYLNNTGVSADVIGGIPTITGNDPGDFALSFSLTGPGNTLCISSTLLNAQAVCVIGVVFTPTQTGLRTATLQVTDTATGSPHSIPLQGGTGAAPLQITTTSPLPGGTVGAAYSTTLVATGGTPPYAWSFSTGNLPPGLSVGATGIISGTPTMAGTFTFSVRAMDSTSPTPQSVMGTFSITVTTSTGGLTFTSTTLPAGAVTVPYGADIQVTGGVPPYTFAVANGSTLPTGFTLDPTATTGSNAVAGHIHNNAPQTAGTFTFGVTVMDSTTPTPLTGNATISLTIAAMPVNAQPGLLKGQYAMLLRGFDELTGVEKAMVGSLTFDGAGKITVGAVDISTAGTGSPGILSNVATTGVYVIGADNRGVMSITPAGQTPEIFTFSVGDVLSGVASTAYMTSFTDNSGAGDLYAGILRLQDPTSFNNAAFAGTYVYDNTGQDPAGHRAAEIGLTTLNAANAVTSGSADTNLNGFVGSVRSITGSYTTPDSNGRSLLTLTVNTSPSSVVVYQISANEVVHMTLDARATNALLLGTAKRQPNPGTFSNTSLAGPDVFSLSGTTGTTGTSASIGLLTVTPGTTPTINVTLDTNDNGTVTIGRALTGPLSIAASGRGTMSPGGNVLIFYLTEPDRGFAMSSVGSVDFGPIVPQVGAPFSASPFSSNVFFGMQEAVGGSNSVFSGVAVLAPGAFNVTEDESHFGGNLFFDASIGTLNFAVASNGHFTSNAGSNIGQQTGYMISPFEVVLFDTTHSASNPTPPSRPNVAIAQSIPGQVASPVVIAPTSLTFTSQTLGTTSAPQSVTVSNTGTAAINFAGFTVTGTNAGDFGVPLPTSGTMCNGAGSLAVGASCTINVLFTPTVVGTRTATLNVADNVTGSPQTVALTGTGAGPATGTVAVTPSSLTFASQPVNSTSPAQNVTVTNTGTGSVTFTSFSITGTNSSSFALANGTNACSPTGTLAASASCTIGVTLTPTVTGELVATLSIADSATGSPQTVALNGTGNNSPVIISIPPGGSTTGTATPGGTAFYGLQITGAPGVTGTVQLGCTPSSPTITCAVIPSSVVLTGKPVEVAFGIQTFCQGATGTGFVPGGPGGGPAGGIGLLLFTLALGGAAWAMQRNRRLALTFAVLMLVALGTAACGGLAKGPNGATPPGTYTLTLTTTFNGQTQTLPNFLTLVVK